MLNGLKVIEMATYIAAPAASAILADWGADVIKIEPLSGCSMRKFYSTAMRDEYPDNAVFDLDNRGKRAIAVNTSDEEGRALVRKLIEDADVFLTNVRPAQLEEQGLDYARLSKINPKLVYASVTGFGLEGPERDKPGFDSAAFWAKSGLAWIMTPKGGSPDPLRTGVGDHVTGISTAAGILAGVVQAQKTGQGQLVESSLLRSATYIMGADFATYLRYGRIARSRPREAAYAPIANFYESQDGKWVFIQSRPGEPEWEALCAIIGQPELAQDPLYATPQARRKNAEQLIALLDQAFSQMSFDDLCAALQKAQIVYAPVQTYDQISDDPQASAAGVFVDQPDGKGGNYRAPASPIRFNAFDTSPKGPAPKLGGDTRDVLAQYGYSDEEIDALLTKGTIGATA